MNIHVRELPIVFPNRYVCPAMLRGVAMTRHCKRCGTEFTPKGKHQQYCSPECAHKALLEQHPKRDLTKICPICGTEFIPHTYNQKYCSKECSKVAERIMAKAWYIEHVKKKRNFPCSKYRRADSIPIELCLKCKPERCRYD